MGNQQTKTPREKGAKTPRKSRDSPRTKPVESKPASKPAESKPAPSKEAEKSASPVKKMAEKMGMSQRP